MPEATKKDTEKKEVEADKKVEAPKQEVKKTEPAPKKETKKDSEDITLSKAELADLMKSTAAEAAYDAKESVKRELAEQGSGVKPDTSKRLSEPVMFVSEKRGLKIVIEPKQEYRDRITGSVVTIAGKYVHFKEGRFYAQTEAELRAVKEHAALNKGIYEFTKEDAELQKSLAKAQGVSGQKFKAIQNAHGNRLGGQGSVG